MATSISRSVFNFRVKTSRDSGIFAGSESSEANNTTRSSYKDLQISTIEIDDLGLHHTEKNESTHSTDEVCTDFTGKYKINRSSSMRTESAPDEEVPNSTTPLLVNRENPESDLQNDSLYKYQLIPSVQSSGHILMPEHVSSGSKLQLCHADVEVINRCDGLINHLQDTTQKYFNLVNSHKKNKKLFYILAVINIILILCLATFVPVVVYLRRGSGPTERDGPLTDTGVTRAADNRYTICFSCSELRVSGWFSLETLVDVLQTDGKCCFRSIISVMKSQNRMFQVMLEKRAECIENTISLLDRRLLQLEIGSAPDTNEIMRNILTTLAPKEKTTVYLKSAKGPLLEEVFESFGKLNKLRWSSNDQSVILRGNVQLSEDYTSILVMSEAYYFLYTKIQYKPSELAEYTPGSSVSLTYLVYRKRGSISSYIHEAKLNCIFNDRAQEYSSTSEMILHLNRDDEIFISVVDSYKKFLSAESGAHIIGLFEI